MQRIEELVEALRGGIRREVRDHSLLAELNRELQQTPLDSNIANPFTRTVFILYDLSNHHSLVRRDSRTAGGVQYDELALAMKLTVFKMLSSLVVFYSDTPPAQLPLPLLRQSLEIMVLVARLFIDLGQATEIKSLYPLVSSFYQAAAGITPETQMLHHLNSLELMRMDVDRGLLDTHQFRREMEVFLECARNVPNSGSYRQLAQHIALEVTLKLIKAGHAQKTKPIRPLLPEKLAQVLAQVSNFENRLLQNDIPQLKISPFYELFLSLKNSPHQVSEQRLRTFISAGQNFKDPRIFDVVALTGCLLPLEIWLQTYINTRQRCENISSGYKCFIFVVDKFFSNPNPNSTDLVVRHQQTITQLDSYLKMSQLIMLALLMEKKETQEPVVGVLKRVLKVMAHSVIGLYPKTKEMREFGEKAGLLCGKFGLGELGKSVTCILFYYQVLMGTAGQESYSRFYKSNLMEKSSAIFKTIKLAYEIRSGKAPLSSQDVQWVKREPYLAVLFQKELKQSIVLAITPQEFSKAPEKFEIYFMLSANLQSIAEGDLVRLAQHMEQTLIRADLGQVSKLQLRYIGMTIANMLKLVEGESFGACTRGRVGVVLLYLVSIYHFSSQLSTISNGILLNRYSKLMKLLSLSFEGIRGLQQEEKNQCIERYLFLAKGVICWSLEELKLVQASTPNSVAAIEPGSLLFYDLLLSFVITHEKIPQHIEFIRFVRFQLACLTDTVGEGDIALERNLKLLRLYCSSKWIRKPIKLKILRRLIKEELVTESRQVTLEDLNDLILLSELPQERKMYAQYLLKLFGQQGRTYLLMQAVAQPQSYEFLTKQEGQEEDCLF